jgi:hypothetical protein
MTTHYQRRSFAQITKNHEASLAAARVCVVDDRHRQITGKHLPETSAATGDALHLQSRSCLHGQPGP